MLSIKNISKSFAGNVVLKDISMEIVPESIVGIAGPSGGGKSTLLRCIQGLNTVDSGQILCDSKIGFMFQDFQLFPHMTVWQNILYAAKLEKNKSIYELEELAHGLLKKLDIESLVERYPGNLSGGQKQRVALARSLMLQPDLLLCDEPTSGLDIATMGEVVDLLKSVCSKQTAMIIASHDLDFLTRIADRIFLIKNGQIIAHMVVKDLKDPIGYLRTLYGKS
ncbi:MAG: ATP-binding cassette domain-containing protein [Puniceicoccales bacterium]|jgi:polar amino acid transport system ATP-binding protein|nr:ATP-binding cassette domain-containing protein [Puniceicoccales bacterium]